MNIGYACLTLGVPDTQMKSLRLSGAAPDKLAAVIAHNLRALEAQLAYNIRSGIKLFRISSDIIPFASHPQVRFDWCGEFETQLKALGGMIAQSGMRVSMHPGQYTVLNARDADVAARAVEDLAYHAGFLDALGTGSAHKIVLHIGGVYNDKKQSLQRFKTHFSYLDDSVRHRLVIENDDRHFHIGDVLDTASALGIPAVFDNLHHLVNSCGGTDAQWIATCRPTWTDSRQKIHYSQQSADKRPGAHSPTVRVRELLNFCGALPDRNIDVMLEVKDKNLSAVKCLLCTAEKKEISRLENEWSRYKYLVLEHDPRGYQQIRQLLKNKSAYPAAEFYEIVEQALTQPFSFGHAQNAAMHVWGYFKDIADAKEKALFEKLSQTADEESLKRAKRLLCKLAYKYNSEYLKASYYFLDI